MSENANVVFERHRGELDVTQNAHPQRLGPTAWMIAAGAATAAIFGAAALRDWGFELTFTFGMQADPAFQAVDQWHAWMESLGLTEPYRAVRDWFHTLPFLRF
jgi:hypothetical protein